MRERLKQVGRVGVYQMLEVNGTWEFVRDGKVMEVGQAVLDLREWFARPFLLGSAIVLG